MDGLSAGIRMKGGVGYNASKNAYVAIVHTWDNVECLGEPEEWESQEIFPTEDAAMEYYKTYIRPSLERMMSDAKRKKPGITSIHNRFD